MKSININTVCKFFVVFVFGCLSTIQNIHSQCVDPGGNVWAESWVSCQTSTNPNPSRPNSHWILYDFHQPEGIKETIFWNANRINESNRGIKDIIIDYSVDGTTWLTLGNFTIPKAPESANYTGFNGPSFIGIFIKKVLITVVSTHGDANCASIAEIKFFIDPRSCYSEVDECGICDGPGKLTWYKDEDGDGLGNSEITMELCTQPLGFVLNADDNCDTGVLGWADVGPMFIEKGCTGCHGEGAAGGLNLTSYESISQGGNKCGTSLLTGTNLVGVISVTGYSGCGQSISGPTMNERVGGTVTSQELALLQAWVDDGAPQFCQCPPGASDVDNDGVCDALDICEGFNNNLIGTACNDGDPCTINDRYAEDCNCVGESALDSDNDGVCDVQDAAPGNPCTADGVVDGIEPLNWTGSDSNDCDDDGIVLAQGDLDDFAPCIDAFGFLTTAECICENQVQIAGGTFISQNGVGGTPSNSGGLPDGVRTGFLGYLDELVLQYPYLRKGEEICITIGFSDINGIAVFEMNDLGTYRIENTLDSINYFPQEFCIETITDGPQEIVITEDGGGGIAVDGSYYNYCPCSVSDPAYKSPECNCVGNTNTTTGSFVSHINVGGDPSLSGGYPDGNFTGYLGYQDTITLSYAESLANTEICVTAGFIDPNGVMKINQSGQVFTFKNATGNTTFAGQEFCFAAPEIITDQLLLITEVGEGAIRVDGTKVTYCNICGPTDPDTDGDGICDANDPCPNSMFGDSDGDGICDDLDICYGFNDNYDSDGDGVPNGCDLCEGFNDALDSDGDTVIDGCDQCPGGNDLQDSDLDGIPDDCDANPCLNFIIEVLDEVITNSKSAHIEIETNGSVLQASDILYRAGHHIDLMDGFEVNLGATFEAAIGPCN